MIHTIILEYDTEKDSATVRTLNADPSTLYRLQNSTKFTAVHPLSNDLPSLMDLVQYLGADFRAELAQKYGLSDRSIRRILSGKTKSYDLYWEMLTQIIDKFNNENPRKIQAAAWLLFLVNKFTDKELMTALTNWTPDDTVLEEMILQKNIEQDDVMETDPDV